MKVAINPPFFCSACSFPHLPAFQVTISLKERKERKERAQPNANQHLQQRNGARSFSFHQSYSNNFLPGLLWSATRPAVFLPESTKSLKIQRFWHIRTKHHSGLLKKWFKTQSRCEEADGSPSSPAEPRSLRASLKEKYHIIIIIASPQSSTRKERRHTRKLEMTQICAFVFLLGARDTKKKKERKGLVFKTASCSELPQLPGDLINALCTS